MPIPMPMSKPTSSGGTPNAGYMDPTEAPFECENCSHFDEASSQCNQPDLLKDKPDGKVDAEACCNYFQSAHRSTNDEEHQEGMSDNNSGIGRGLASLK